MPLTEEQIQILEKACEAWWNTRYPTGKMIATLSWDKIPNEWKGDYRIRMREALTAIGAFP